jgi:hypothetical protein
MPTW